MKATPAGLLYTPSIPIVASRDGLRRKLILWFVFSNIPPENTFNVTSNVIERNVVLLFIFTSVLFNFGTKVIVLFDKTDKSDEKSNNLNVFYRIVGATIREFVIRELTKKSGKNVFYRFLPDIYVDVPFYTSILFIR